MAKFYLKSKVTFDFVAEVEADSFDEAVNKVCNDNLFEPVNNGILFSVEDAKMAWPVDGEWEFDDFEEYDEESEEYCPLKDEEN